MHQPINIRLALLPAFILFFTLALQGQSIGFHAQTEQGISALNNFNMERDKGAFGGYAASIGGEYRFPSGFYLKADLQLVSTRLEFRNISRSVQGLDTTVFQLRHTAGTTSAKEFRFAYGAGVATYWKKIRFALDLAYSIEFYQRAETRAEVSVDGFFDHFVSPTTSRYRASFSSNQQDWQLVNNSNHHLQLTGSILIELSPQIGIGLFYRTDLLARWVELQLQLQEQPGQINLLTVERKNARQAMTGVRLTYRLGRRG